MDVALQRLFERTSSLVGADGAAILSLMDPGAPFVPVALGQIERLQGPALSPPGTLAQRCRDTQQWVRGTRADLPPRDAERAERFGIAEIGCHPLIALDGRMVGVLALTWATEGAVPEGALVPIGLMAGAIADLLDRQPAAEQERVRVEAMVSASERRFRAFMDALPAPAWIKNADGRYTFVNEQLQATWRVAAEDFVGRLDQELFPHEVADALREVDAKVRRERRVVRVEERAPTVDGAMRVWWSTKFPIVGDDGEVHVGGVAIDITDRKAAETELRDREERLRRSEADLRTIVDDLVEGMLIQREGRILYANAAMARIAGAPGPAELVGRHVEELCLPEEVAQLRADIASVRPDVPVRRERRARRLDGSPFLAEAHGSLIVYEGQPAVAVLVRDIGEQRQQEQRLALTDRLASIGTLSAAVSHEINNPLTVVMTNLTLLLDELRDLGGPAPLQRMRELQEFTEDAQAGADRIRRIVRSMKTLARDTEGEPPGRSTCASASRPRSS